MRAAQRETEKDAIDVVTDTTSADEPIIKRMASWPAANTSETTSVAVGR